MAGAEFSAFVCQFCPILRTRTIEGPDIGVILDTFEYFGIVFHSPLNRFVTTRFHKKRLGTGLRFKEALLPVIT